MSLLGALAITLFAGLGIWIGQKTLFIPVNGTYATIMVIAVGLFAYLAIQFILDRYIYRRIKLIYKIIRRPPSFQFKATSIS